MMSSTAVPPTQANLHQHHHHNQQQINGNNQLIGDLPPQHSHELQSHQTSDSDQSVSTHSQDNDRRTQLSLPTITGPNGSTVDGSTGQTDYSESEKSVRSSQKTSNKSSNEWEILEGLKDGQKCETKPNQFDGYMLKRRKWPLKGWHKRYFHLENGILSYSKSPNDMMKGKIHGSVDVGLSVISTKKSSKRIDIDAEEFIYHLKVKNRLMFSKWVSTLKHHRLYRQHEIAFGNKINAVSTPIRSPVVGSAQTTPHRDMNSKVVAWILDSTIDPLNVSEDFSDLQLKLVKLSSLLKVIEMQVESTSQAPDAETVSLKKRRRFLRLRRKAHNQPNVANDKITKKSNDKSDNTVVHNDVIVDKNRTNLKPLPIGHHLSSSHPTLNECDGQPSHDGNNTANNWMSQSCNEAEMEFNSHTISSGGHKLTKVVVDFVHLANDVNTKFRSLYRWTQTDSSKKIRLKESSDDLDLISSLRQSLSETLKQNKELREKLKQIHETSNIAYYSPITSPVATKITRATSITEDDIDEQTVIHEPLAQSVSRDSTSALSISEYFDAEENLSACTTSTEDEDEESVITDLSDDGTEYRTSKKSLENMSIVGNTTGRRSKLPVPQPDTGDVSLWSLLCKNIGKDLSKISMPVTINEPLSVLQRLCEELEYSELLDKAANIDDSRLRMLYIAAFAVSSYSSAYYRAGHKPFNPLLSETYECVREDKGFRFVSEQVSHHPPISACHAEADNFVFYQDMRIKTKFWGKSMEIIPFGTVHVLLPALNAHYKYNKVTTCVHNLFKGQRWVDAYGELTITDGELTCRLTFEKASYWSNKKHEVNGVLLNSNGDVIERLFGKWNESLHCGAAPNAKCIWRPGAMPEGYEKYYGFSRFAIELNELTPELQKVLPPTDTRFRPDQRLLEEGEIASAEVVKLQLEQQQRERRKAREQAGQSDPHPLWFRKEVNNSGEECYKYGDQYWPTREKGFEGIQFEKLW